MNGTHRQGDAAYPRTEDMQAVVDSLGPTTLFDLFATYGVPEGARLGLVEETLGLVIVRRQRTEESGRWFLAALEARCRAYAEVLAADPEEPDFPGSFELVGRVEYLCQASQDEVFRDPRRAVELAERAVELADRIDPEVCGEGATAEQRILARAWLGNALRVASDLHGAERVFAECTRWDERSAPPWPVVAQVWSLLGSLRIDQGRYDDARRVLNDALTVYGALRAEPEQTIVRIKLANSEGYAGEPDRAVGIFRAVVEHFTENVDDRLRLEAEHNLIDWMIDAGQPMEALARYEKARSRYDEFFQAPSLQLRRRWLEGRIHAALGDLQTASIAFEEVRATAIERELSYELAAVSLELALVHLRQREIHRVRELAEEMVPIFRSRGLHRHALGAMSLFRQAARTGSVTVGLVEEMLRYFRRSWNNPRAPFEPPEPSDPS